MFLFKMLCKLESFVLVNRTWLEKCFDFYSWLNLVALNIKVKWLSHRNYVYNSSFWLARENVSERILCFF